MTRKSTLALLGITAVALSLLAGTEALAQEKSDWPQWRGPNRDGHSPDRNLMQSWEQSKPELVWQADGLGQGFASVAVADGRIFTTGNTPQGQAVIAVDANDGSVLWKSPITDENPQHSYEGSRSTPTVDGDRLYVVSSNGQILCLKVADGEIVWRKDFRREWNGRMMSGWGYSESPLVDGDRVICTPGGPQAMMVALNKTNGREIWRSQVNIQGGNGQDGAGYSSIVVSEVGRVRQYVQLVGRGLIGVRATDGRHLWTYNKVANGTANIPTPIPIGNYIFCSSGYGTGAALLKMTPARGGVRMTEEYFLPGRTFQNHHGGMVRVGNHIYCGHGHNNGFPICLEWKTGKVVWGGEIRGAGSGSAAVAFADGHLIFRYQSGEVALIEATPNEYRLKGSFRPEVVQSPSWAHPVVCGGKLYLREQDSLMCYDLRQ